MDKYTAIFFISESEWTLTTHIDMKESQKQCGTEKANCRIYISFISRSQISKAIYATLCYIV